MCGVIQGSFKKGHIYSNADNKKGPWKLMALKRKGREPLPTSRGLSCSVSPVAFSNYLVTWQGESQRIESVASIFSLLPMYCWSLISTIDWFQTVDGRQGLCSAYIKSVFCWHRSRCSVIWRNKRWLTSKKT